jgi:hypothetical protein
MISYTRVAPFVLSFSDILRRPRPSSGEYQDGVLVGRLLLRTLRRSTEGGGNNNQVTKAMGEVYPCDIFLSFARTK